jgi:hypothetical protein
MIASVDVTADERADLRKGSAKTPQVKTFEVKDLSKR